MSPFLSIFTLVYPFSIGFKGGVCFEKEGFFNPSFFLEERRIFTEGIISPLSIEYDSLNLFTKSNSLGLNLVFKIKENFLMLEGTYTNLSQVLDIYRKYEYIKTRRVYEGFNLSIMLGRNIRKIYLASGFEYFSITGWKLFKIETGVFI